MGATGYASRPTGTPVRLIAGAGGILDDEARQLPDVGVELRDGEPGLGCLASSACRVATESALTGDLERLLEEHERKVEALRQALEMLKRLPSTAQAMAKPGKTAIQGASSINVWASLSIRPQEGCGGWVPRPR